MKIRLEDSELVSVVKRIGRGQFSTAYLDLNGQVIILVKSDQNSKDESKHILRDCENIHIPEIRWLGYTHNFRHEVFVMDFYDKLTPNSPEAWSQAKILSTKWTEFVDNHGGWKHAEGYQFCQNFVESLAGILPETITEALGQIVYNMSNYSDVDGYTFEFPTRNLKVDKNGQLILLDVLFNRRAIFSKSS